MAGPYYVRSTSGGGTHDGSSWTNAFLTLAAAFAACAAGDTLYVSQAHAESTNAALALTSPGTAASPVFIICGNDAAQPPTALATTATISTGNGVYGITFAGFAYCYGITFSCAAGGANACPISFGLGSAASWWWKLDTCVLYLATTGATTPRINVGNNSAVFSLTSLLELVNTSVKFGNAAQGIVVCSHLIWINSTGIATGGTLPTTLFLPVAAGMPGFVVCNGVDFSALGSGKSLVNAATAVQGNYSFQDCELGASVSTITGTIAGQGGPIIDLDNCDSGDPASGMRSESYRYQGSILANLATYLTATDGLHAFSLKMASLSTCSYYSPLTSRIIPIWNTVTGAGKTVTIEFLHDNVTGLYNDEIWVNVYYLGTASSTLASKVTTQMVLLGTHAANGAGIGAGSWTKSMTNPNSQHLQTGSFTPQEVGFILVEVCLAKASYTVYVDPTITVA